MATPTFEPLGEWDRELTEEEWDKMHHTLRRLRTDSALKRKIELLELWGEIGLPPGVEYEELAADRTALRRWHDASRGLWSWAKSTPDSLTGRNRTLMARWKPALARIANRAHRAKFSKSDREAQNLRIAALERQVAELIADKAWLEEQLSLAETSGSAPVARTPSAKKTGSPQRRRTS